MPQVQVVDTTPNKPEPTGVQEFFSKLSTHYKERADQDKIANILKAHQENRKDASELFKSYEALERSNVGPTKRLQAKKDLKDIEDALLERDKLVNVQAKQLQAEQKAQKDKETEQESVYELYTASGVPEQEARRLSKIDSPATARGKIKDANKKETPAGLSPFEKTLQTEEAKKLVQLETDIPKARDALKNLDRIEELSKTNLKGPLGYVKSALRTEAATEMSNLSLAAIEPVIKLFNPVGAIPVQKINLIKKQFQAHPSDLQSTINGKVAALRRLGEQALARAQERATLIRQYKGAPPPEALQQFDAQSEQLLDAIVDEEAPKLDKGKQIKVKAPDGSLWSMTQSQIDNAKSKGVVFEPVK